MNGRLALKLPEKNYAADFVTAAREVNYIDWELLGHDRAVHRLGSLAQGRGMNAKVVQEAAKWAISAQKTMRLTQGHKGADAYPLAVAASIVMLNLDQRTASKAESVVATLLHEAVANKLITLNDVKEAFGTEAAMLTDQVARITRMGRKIKMGSELCEADFSFNQTQFEVAQEALCSMPYSSRVVPIKLFDCLHSMRTLELDQNNEERMRRALFADHTFIPIARYYEYNGVRRELQDLVMKAIDPVSAQRIHETMQLYRQTVNGSQRPAVLENVEQKFLEIYGVNRPIDREIDIKSRVKGDYEVWKKMKRRQNEATRERIVGANRIGLELPKEERTFTYSVRPENFDALFVGVSDRIAARIEVVDGKDQDTLTLAQRFGQRLKAVHGTTKDYITKPRTEGRADKPYIGYHQAYYIVDSVLGVVPVEVQFYKSDDKNSNFSDHHSYKGRKGFIVPDVMPHVVQRKQQTRKAAMAVAFQNASLVTEVATRTALRMTGAAAPDKPFTPDHIVVVAEDGAFIPLRVKDGADPTKPEYPTIGDFIFAIHTNSAPKWTAAIVEGVRWDLRPSELKPGTINPLSLNLMTGDHIVLLAEHNFNDIGRYKGHLRVKRSREALATMIRLTQTLKT